MSPRTLLLCCCIPFTGLSHAEHLPGGSITYECLGDNTYTISLTLLRECTGEPMIPQTLYFNNSCGVTFSLEGLLPDEVEDVSPLCPSELSNGGCNGGALIGIEKYTYRQTVYLSPCSSWRISWRICCRQSSINVQGNPGMYLEALLNNQSGVCNNSPMIDEPGIPVVCVGQPVVYDPGVSETDGHRLQFRFIEARYAAPAPTAVLYTFPYYGLEPFSGMAIDPGTGTITFTPTVQGHVITAFQVDEYDAADNWLGSVMRDFPFLVRACSDPPPSPGAGTISSVSGTGSQDGDRAVRVCSNGEVCMEMVFTDPDAGQTLSIRTNVTTVLPGAVVTSSGGNPLTVNICWDATDAGPMTSHFTITASDNACPVPGTGYYTYHVSVEAPPNDLGNGSATACPRTEVFALVDSLGSPPPYPGQWTDPDGASHSGLFDPSSDLPGDHIFTMSSFPGCSVSATVSVILLPEAEEVCTLLGIAEQALEKPLLYPNPGTGRFVLRVPRTWQGALLQARIQDMQGRSLGLVPLSDTHGGMTFEMPDALGAGSYSLLVEDPSGNTSVLRLFLLR